MYLLITQPSPWFSNLTWVVLYWSAITSHDRSHYIRVVEIKVTCKYTHQCVLIAQSMSTVVVAQRVLQRRGIIHFLYLGGHLQRVHSWTGSHFDPRSVHSDLLFFQRYYPLFISVTALSTHKTYVTAQLYRKTGQTKRIRGESKQMHWLILLFCKQKGRWLDLLCRKRAMCLNRRLILHSIPPLWQSERLEEENVHVVPPPPGNHLCLP